MSFPENKWIPLSFHWVLHSAAKMIPFSAPLNKNKDVLYSPVDHHAEYWS